MSKKVKLGSGERFAAIEESAEKKGYSKASAQKIAASAGIKKYGAEKMSKMAAKGRKHGMQMGSEGFGLTHGYSKEDETMSNDHEYI